MVNAKKIACNARVFAIVPINIINVNVPHAAKYQPTKDDVTPCEKNTLNKAKLHQKAP